MSEEQIINYIKRDIEETSKQIENGDLMIIEDNEKIRIAFLQGLLDLYNKEKEKNKNSISIEEIEKVLENSVSSYDCLKYDIQSLLYGEDCHR